MQHGVPYQRGGPPGASSEVVGASTSRRVTVHNIDSFEKREKPLPPDAAVEKAPRTKLYQFPDRVAFYCAKCRMDNILSDSVAFDASNTIMICVRCFERIVRPRKYRPSRVVPFPSLLSWLNYKPSEVTEVVPEDIHERAAEAAAPSGNRVATDMLGGNSTDLRLLQATPLMLSNVLAPAASSSGAVSSASKHPCLRVWGTCAHGSLCSFREAPRDLCIARLMGLCIDDNCPLIHQQVFGLPKEAAPRPRRAGDLSDPASALSQWLERRKRSKAEEYQLFHNGPLEQLLEAYLPEQRPPVLVEGEDGGTIEVNVDDITSALDFLDS